MHVRSLLGGTVLSFALCASFACSDTRTTATSPAGESGSEDTAARDRDGGDASPVDVADLDASPPSGADVSDVKSRGETGADPSDDGGGASDDDASEGGDVSEEGDVRSTPDGSPIDDASSQNDADGGRPSSGSDTSSRPPVDATDGGTGRDTTTSSGADSTSLTCSGGRTPCSGSCVDTSSNRNHCGTCGNSCSSKARCTNGTCTCPRYHKKCGGSCVPVNIDPDNCGGCGTTCASGEVCSSGQCTSQSCLPGREPCGRRCVNTDTDSDNCGQCGRSCPSGQGCVNGTCVKKVPAGGNAPAKCKGGGPSIDVGLGSSTQKCLGNLAQRTFRWSICSCESVRFKNNLYTDAFDSTVAPYKKGGFGGGVGSNGSIEVGKGEINGAVWSSSSRGIRGERQVTISQEVHSGGRLSFGNTTRIGGDAYVEGKVTGKGPIRFDKTLYLDPSGSIQTRGGGGNKVRYNTLKRQSVDVSTVCKRCTPGNRIPVGQIVQQHVGGNNDNGVVGLDPGDLIQPGGARRLELPCGEYYLSGIDVQEKLSIVVTGRTALHIGGDFVSKNDVVVKPTSGAELDLFVEGDVRLMNNAQLGSAAYPASTRVYVGGNQGIELGNNADVGAFIYADPGAVQTPNNFEMFGGIHTQKLKAKNNARIHYDRAVLNAGDQCPPKSPPGSGGGDAGPDGGLDAGPTGDTGGGDQLCTDNGNACTEDADCCAPLVCSDQTCSVASCTPLDLECQQDSDCCSGNCESTSSYSYCASK